MTSRKRRDSEREISLAGTKLSRLLETENELDAMLKEAKRQAKEIVDAAQIAADNSIKELESQLAEEDRELRGRIASNRDRTIDTIRKEARLQVDQLGGIDDDRIAELARHVIDLLVGSDHAGGQS